MTSVAFCSMLKAGTFFLFKSYLKLKHVSVLHDCLRNDDKGHVYCSWSRSRIVRLLIGTETKDSIFRIRINSVC